MNYRKLCIYMCVCIMHICYWCMLENKFLDIYDGYNLLFAIVGTHGGYGFFLTISTVFMLIHLILVSNNLSPFSIHLLSRKNRVNALNICYKKLVIGSVVYAFLYEVVQVIFIWLLIDFNLLIEIHFFKVMFMHFVAIALIFMFGASIYLLFYIKINNKYMAILISVAINVSIAYFTNTKILYGGIEVIDKMTRLQAINIIEWLIYQIINILIIVMIYAVTEEVYKKRDIYDRF